jgi:4-amino-4-deoxy-L-arabinose transferase-like glycosyltransferase
MSAAIPSPRRPLWLDGPSAKLLIFIAAVTLVRLVFAAVTPLTEDEAYYRLWAQHPAFGYFDHPPMVAWWIGGGVRAFGDDPFGLRCVAALATGLASLLIVRLARLSGFSVETSERAAVWYNAMILIALGGAVMTPDAPATLFWLATLWALAQAWRGAPLWWIGAGAFAGLAALSKYSAFFLAPGVFLWLLASVEGRRRLLTPWPWLCLATAVVVFSPNIVWNAGHQWLTFAKQFSRISAGHLTPRHMIDFPASQFFLLNPIIAVFAAVGVARLVRRRAEADPLRLLIPATTAPFLLYLVLHSTHAGVQAHWPAPLYPGLAISAAYAAEAGKWRGAARAAPWFGLIIGLLVLAHLAAPQTDGLGRRDPALQLRGWDRFGQDVEALRLRVGARWIGVFRYGTAAQLELQHPKVPILALIERARYQFLDRPPEIGGPGLVVELARRIDRADLDPCFAHVTPLPDLHRGDVGGVQVAYHAYLADGPKFDLAAHGCRLGKDPD